MDVSFVLFFKRSCVFSTCLERQTYHSLEPRAVLLATSFLSLAEPVLEHCKATSPLLLDRPMSTVCRMCLFRVNVSAHSTRGFYALRTPRKSLYGVLTIEQARMLFQKTYALCCCLILLASNACTSSFCNLQSNHGGGLPQILSTRATSKHLRSASGSIDTPINNGGAASSENLASKAEPDSPLKCSSTTTISNDCDCFHASAHVVTH